MSLRNRLVLPIILATFAVLAGCSSNNGVTNPVAPPSGTFSNSNLNGTYVFSVSGIDAVNSAPYAVVGTFTANGSGGITGGTLDMNDAEFASVSPAIAPLANASISGNSSYHVGVDGRGQATLNVSTPFGSKILLDFVLEDASHGLVTEFDGNVTGTGSGTLDLQSAGTTPTGSYAFIFSGAIGTSSSAAVGNFTLGSGGTITSGIEDFNEGGIANNINQTLSGQVVLGPSATPSTRINTTNISGTYDVFAINAAHLKFIEMDANGTLSGDALSQSTPTIPTGTMAFTLQGGTSTPIAAGGFMVTNGAGNITTASTEDVNNGGNVAATASFSAQYSSAGAGRFILNNFSNFVGGTEYAAYPSSGGLLLLEIDGSGFMAGIAYPQTSGATFAASQGYGLNLSGTNGATGTIVEVDDIAEFAAKSSGNTVTGVIDENSDPGALESYAAALSGTFGAPDSNGRGQIAANAGNSTNSTLNGGFNLTFYTVDGTTFPFIETDGSQVSAGVFVAQNPAAAASAIAKPHMLIAPPVVRPHAAQQKQK
jgi:hypothetical protein